MRIAVAGSVATDHLMRFPGRFADALVPEKLDQLSVSFLVDQLDVRRGGVAANICFGLGLLGLRPVLVAAAGTDFADYRSWLDRHGVDTVSVRESETLHTARFVCTTDLDGNQIASFYPGAMVEARMVELEPVAQRLGGLDLVVIAPDDPEAMLRHTQACRRLRVPFVADPSQQLASMGGPQVRKLLDGAAYLFCNAYESALIARHTGWDEHELQRRVDVLVTTHGSDGAVVARAGHEPIHVDVPRERRRADPTGVGDGFRAGFLAGLSWGLSLQRCAQLGCTVATCVLETVGTQEYELDRADVRRRLLDAYGADAADDIAAHLHAA